MNKLINLIRINTKDTIGRYMQQINVKGKILGKIIALLPLIAILPAIGLTLMIYDSFAKLNMGYLALTYTSLGSVILMLVSAVPLIVSTLFYSKDLSLLATLPLKGRTIIMAKLTSVYPYLFVLGLGIFGTTAIYYMNDAGFQLRAVIIGICTIITLPLIPLALGTLITLPFMSLVAGRKHRNLFTVFGNLLLLGVILGLEVFMARTASNPDQLIKILSQKDGLLNLIGKGYPPSIWLTKAIVSSNLDALWYFLLQAGAVVLIIILATKIYDQALKKYNQQESSSERQAIKYRRSTIKLMLLKRNLGIIFSNPTFLLNTVMTIFIPIIIFVIYSLMGIMNINTLSNPLLMPFREYIFFGIVIAPSIIGSLSATSISREGKFFWETRSLPIRHKDSLASRELTTLLLNGVGQFILAIAAYVILPIAPIKLIGIVFTTIFGTLLMSKVDLMINIERPYLNWSNPTACIKNNMNVMLSLGTRVLLGGLGYGVFKIFQNMGASYVIFFIGLLFMIIYALTLILFKKVYLRKYSEIDAL